MLWPRRFFFELLLLTRKWVILLPGVLFRDAFWSLVVSTVMFVIAWATIVRWKPFATHGSQFDARLTQVALLVLQVCGSVPAGLCSYVVGFVGLFQFNGCISGFVCPVFVYVFNFVLVVFRSCCCFTVIVAKASHPFWMRWMYCGYWATSY